MAKNKSATAHAPKNAALDKILRHVNVGSDQLSEFLSARPMAAVGAAVAAGFLVTAAMLSIKNRNFFKEVL